MGWLSVNIDFSNREVLLVGAGQVGRRKLADLLAAGARVRVIEPKVDPFLAKLQASGEILLENEFKESFLDARPWVFLALDDNAEAQRLGALARGRGLLVNRADRPEDCDFFMPALVGEAPFRLTVSTLGHAPALSARVAKELRTGYRGYGDLARLLGRVRPLILNSGLDPKKRRLIFKVLAEDKSLPELLSLGDKALLLAALKKDLEPVEIPPDYPLFE
ncbi:MAG: bifunctional precorrin-2 dehydrogenase/sirohydrochlorin ferrochelatase [Deltaproteobacteria bacterium]|jgi:siroheme synthase-like protein|nr:bifunctional precorrin-2 dehydrogenase/sirohydrochlorin ferrochelatase [Deltaproteobacteria bacterium]